MDLTCNSAASHMQIGKWAMVLHLLIFSSQLRTSTTAYSKRVHHLFGRTALEYAPQWNYEGRRLSPIVAQHVTACYNSNQLHSACACALGSD